MTSPLRGALHEYAEQMPPARVPDDLWRQGRRRRRREHLRTATLLTAVLLVVSTLPWLARPGEPAPPAAGGPAAVPFRLHLPRTWQATVPDRPAGPASVLFSGTAPGLRGIDLVDHEGKVAVVGRDGSYRMLLYGGAERVAGEDVVLSPDGRSVAHGFLAGADDGWLLVTDLSTGRTRTFRDPDGEPCCGQPVAWAPDGRSILAVDASREPVRTEPETGNGLLAMRLVLLDLTTGRSAPLVELGEHAALRTSSVAAFSPDGARIAVTVGTQLRVLDRTGRTGWTAELGARRHLAGPAAFSPDGRRITTMTMEGCLDDCDEAALAARVWRVGYLDATTGAQTAGPALPAVTAMAVRAVGWRAGVDLAVLTYRPDSGIRKQVASGWNDTGFWEVGDVSLQALPEGGPPEVLLDPPDQVRGLDVARDLLDADRFGGPAPEPGLLPVRPLGWVLASAALLPVILSSAGLLWWLRRRRAKARAPG